MLANGEMEYMIGVPTDKEVDNEESYDMLDLEAQTYIVFDAVGKVPQAVKETIAQIHQNVLPQLDVTIKQAPFLNIIYREILKVMIILQKFGCLFLANL